MKPLSSSRTQTLRYSWICVWEHVFSESTIPAFSDYYRRIFFPSQGKRFFAPRPHSSTRNRLVLLICPTSALNGLRLAIPLSGSSSTLIPANPDPSNIEALDQNPVAAEGIIVDHDIEAQRQAQDPNLDFFIRRSLVEAQGR